VLKPSSPSTDQFVQRYTSRAGINDRNPHHFFDLPRHARQLADAVRVYATGGVSHAKPYRASSWTNRTPVCVSSPSSPARSLKRHVQVISPRHSGDSQVRVVSPARSFSPPASHIGPSPAIRSNEAMLTMLPPMLQALVHQDPSILHQVFWAHCKASMPHPLLTLPMYAHLPSQLICRLAAPRCCHLNTPILPLTHSQPQQLLRHGMGPHELPCRQPHTPGWL
jgi:hypothetical protein